jgi:hypothetical protein
MARVCRLARAEGPSEEWGARLFLEANFRPQAVGDQGLLTAYFAPKYDARMSRSAEFSAPVRGVPADLVVLDLGPFEPTFAGKKVTGRVKDGKFQPYPDRATIEASPADKPLAWMRPEELFFLQIQGSGILVMPDGRRVRAAFAGGNGKPFVGIANAMRDRGLLPGNNTSGDAIRVLAGRQSRAQGRRDHAAEPALHLLQAVARTTARKRWARPACHCRPAGPSPSIPAATPWVSCSGSTPARPSWPAPFRPIAAWPSRWTWAARSRARSAPISTPARVPPPGPRRAGSSTTCASTA